MKISLNDNVKVKVTEEGEKRAREDYKALTGKDDKLPLERDEDGWTEDQLWHLMSTYGPHIFLGGPNILEMEMEIPDPVVCYGYTCRSGLTETNALDFSDAGEEIAKYRLRAEKAEILLNELAQAASDGDTSAMSDVAVAAADLVSGLDETDHLEET